MQNPEQFRPISADDLAALRTECTSEAALARHGRCFLKATTLEGTAGISPDALTAIGRASLAPDFLSGPNLLRWRSIGRRHQPLTKSRKTK